MLKSELFKPFILIFISILISYCGQPGSGKNQVESGNDTTKVGSDSLQKDS